VLGNGWDKEENNKILRTFSFERVFRKHPFIYSIQIKGCIYKNTDGMRQNTIITRTCHNNNDFKLLLCTKHCAKSTYYAFVSHQNPTNMGGYITVSCMRNNRFRTFECFIISMYVNITM
jgi:hypothetical protein